MLSDNIKWRGNLTKDTAAWLAAVFVSVAAHAAEGDRDYRYVHTATSSAKAHEFLENQKSFRLGFLPTERSNPITASLESDFRRSYADGVACLQRADRQVAITLRHALASTEFAALRDAMAETLRSPRGRIVFSGCGATGREAILLESMWRDFFARRAGELTPEERLLADKVVSIMTAGDFALIKSVEFFEDYFQGGARQSETLGVGAGDVFIAINGGGECSTILGSLDYAAKHGARSFMNVNNPRELLRRIERSRALIDDPRVTTIDLYCGSMAIAGSTRMQSTTSQQLFYCAALEQALAKALPKFAKELPSDYAQAFEDLLEQLERAAARDAIARAIEFEKSVYAAGGRITYLADDCMLDLFTDNTERSPTFMLPQLKSCRETVDVQSWAFVKNPCLATPDCWMRMFNRAPRCLDGFSSADARSLGMPQKAIDNPPKIGCADLMEYKIGNEPAPERIKGFPRAAAVTFAVGDAPSGFLAAAGKLAAAWPERRTFQIGRTGRHLPEHSIHVDIEIPASPLHTWKHLAVKLVLNNLSTGTMVAMGRVAGNYMSWVSISNKKLTDRGARLLRDLGGITYAEALERLFAAEEWIEARDWSVREKPCAVQLALSALRRERSGRLIAVPDAATAVEREAAGELQDALKRMLGKAPAIVSESEAGSAGEVFFVGATRAAAALTNTVGIAGWKYDAVLVQSVKNGLVLTGHPVRGAFYAVDEYLERFCGVRWWTSRESKYPKRDDVPMCGISFSHAPTFRFRETYYLDSFHALFKVRTKGNFSSLTRYMLDPMEFIPPELGGNHRMHFFPGRRSAYHSFFEILPPDRHFASHPEWYSCIKGKRKPSQLCLSNQEMTKAFIDATRRILQGDRESDFISISQNDCTSKDPAGPCECDSCAAIAADEGAQSGGVIRFVNRVAEELEAEFPHVNFDTFAYTWSRAAPKKVKARRNVTVRYCDIECPFSFPLDTPGNAACESFMENLKAWSAAAPGNLYIWDYVTNFRNYMIPHPNLHALARNVRIFAEAGAAGVFEQGDALCAAGEFSAFRHWLLSHLLWDATLDEKALTEDFLKGYYGPSAAPKIREYLSIVNDRACSERIPVRCYHYNVTNFMDEASSLAAERKMAEALKAAAADGEDCARRVAKEKLSIDQALLLNWKELRAWCAERGEPWPLGDDYSAAAERWISATKGLGVKGVHETVTRGTFDAFCEKLRNGTPDR